MVAVRTATSKAMLFRRTATAHTLHFMHAGVSKSCLQLGQHVSVLQFGLLHVPKLGERGARECCCVLPEEAFSCVVKGAQTFNCMQDNQICRRLPDR